MSEISSPLVSEKASAARFSKIVAKLVVHGADLDDHRHPISSDTHIELVELGWRPVGRDHDLTPAIDQRIQGMAEFLLNGRPCKNSMSSISKISIWRSFSLKASASRARKACTKPDMKRSAVR